LDATKGPITGDGDTFTGSVTGLGINQTVWIFAQVIQFSDPKAAGRTLDPALTMETGPCDITGNRWKCTNVWSSVSSPAFDGDYKIWAAVLDTQDARLVVQKRKDNGGVIGGTEPPHVGTAADSQLVQRRFEPPVS
jgi:hypothetical protein